MYTMCTGRPPFRADTSFGVLRRITDTQPRPIREVNPDIPPWLVAIIDRLLAKEPADRFASATEVAQLLEQCLAHVQQPASVALPVVCRVGQAKRRPTVLAAIALCGAAILVVALAAYFLSTGAGDRTSLDDQSPASASPNPAAIDFDWNVTAESIDTLTSDVQALDERAIDLWETQSAASSAENNPGAVP
jgi:serine/threonine protein kinase